METKKYDIVIIGGGVAGMSSAIYAKRRGKKVAIIEKYTLGGQVLTINKIENFPSQSLIDGFSLSQNFAKQVRDLRVEIINDEIISCNLSSKQKLLSGKKFKYVCDSVIIASGLVSVPYGLNEDDFLGRGVSYCAVCDANFFKKQPVCVASDGGSGIAAAITLSEVCEKVTVLDKKDMSIFANANKNKKIEVISNAEIVALNGTDQLNSVQYEKDGVKNTLQTNALFIELGKKPSTEIFKEIKKDEKSFIITDENMRTNIQGVFAVGDVRSKNLRQIVTACSDGAIAGQLA